MAIFFDCFLLVLMIDSDVYLQYLGVKNLYKCSLRKNGWKGGILMLYIGVDLGTSACKFLLVDETGKVCN